MQDQRTALCRCGCGRPAPIAKRTNAARGYIKGRPVRYINGHNAQHRRKLFIAEDRGHDTVCWIWPGALRDDGYGPHRLVWERLRGPVPAGMQLDHLCEQHDCVNPDHLEPVTQLENLRRADKVKLTADDAREIRRLAGTLTQRAIAERFGISHTHVRQIVNGQKWRRA